MNTNKVLIVEDDASIRSIYELILNHAGFDVTVASGGEGALRQLEKSRFDLMLLDLMMPDVDGIDVLKHIRTNKVAGDMKIVIMTNMGSNREELELENYGVTETVLKVDLLPDDLVKLVQKHI